MLTPLRTSHRLTLARNNYTFELRIPARHHILQNETSRSISKFIMTDQDLGNIYDPIRDTLIIVFDETDRGIVNELATLANRHCNILATQIQRIPFNTSTTDWLQATISQVENAIRSLRACRILLINRTDNSAIVEALFAATNRTNERTRAFSAQITRAINTLPLRGPQSHGITHRDARIFLSTIFRCFECEKEFTAAEIENLIALFA